MDELCVMTWNDHCLTAALSGEVDHHMALALRNVLDEEIRAGAQRWKRVDLIFDFSEVSFMDSSGIGVVMGRYNTVRIAGGNIYVTGCDPYVERLLEMAGIWLITTKMATGEEALAASRERRRNNG